MYILKNKILYFLFIFLFFLKFTNAQKNYNLEYGFATGASNYLGDIGGGLNEQSITCVFQEMTISQQILEGNIDI